jgi:DNA-binding Lrp family transcriptional regulator
MVPRSISSRLRQLAGKTAGELLRLLCELTIGFRQTSVERSYRQLAELLGKSVATIARAVKLLLKDGDVVVESRLGRSYRWSVLLEPSDVRSDPAGICKVRVTQADEASIPGVIEKPKLVEEPKAQAKPPIEATVCDEPKPETDEAPQAKTLLKRLVNISMRRRIAKDLLAEHDHSLIAAALDRVKTRSDIKNKAGYVLREVQEGGYEDEMTADATHAARPTSSANASRYSSAERTRLEQEQLEAESVAQQQNFDNAVKTLEARCGQLSEGVKAQLRECCHGYLAQLVPQTSSKGRMLEGPASKAFKKIAFKEVTERFFRLLDHGVAEEEALGQVAFAIS